MTNIILCGEKGKMGLSILDLIGENPSFNYLGSWKEAVESNFGEASCLVDFSSPEGFQASLNWAVDHLVPFVSGTTGLSESQRTMLVNAGQKIPVLWSANMSIGIQWFLKAIETLEMLAKDFDFQLEEAHHKHKVDAPSGTAILLQEKLKSVLQTDPPSPLAIRGGGVFGVHTLWTMGSEEVIKIEHQAMNRKVFARGALSAASFLARQKPGVYQMSDVLKEKV